MSSSVSSHPKNISLIAVSKSLPEDKLQYHEDVQEAQELVDFLNLECHFHKRDLLIIY